MNYVKLINYNSVIRIILWGGGISFGILIHSWIFFNLVKCLQSIINVMYLKNNLLPRFERTLWNICDVNGNSISLN